LERHRPKSRFEALAKIGLHGGQYVVPLDRFVVHDAASRGTRLVCSGPDSEKPETSNCAKRLREGARTQKRFIRAQA
jgi:hypothetical protein